MQCNRCRSDPVIFQPYSGRNLCRDHFIADFEARAKRVIRKHQWMCPGDHIAIPLCGDRASSALLFFLQELAGRRRDVRITAIPGNREMMADPDDSTFEEAVARIDATRFALAISLDEIAVSVLGEILRGLPGPEARDHGEQRRDKGGQVPCIYPFSVIPAEEIVLYARLQGVGSDSSPPGDSQGRFHAEVKTLLDEYNSQHPATKYAVANLGHQLAGCSLYMEGEIP
jgi:tRNA(Ile)-lysidine synthase TilS/MesJ